VAHGQRQTAHDGERQRVWLRRDCRGGKSDVVQFDSIQPLIVENIRKFELPGLTSIG
jgi:hypothetical protein